MCGIVGILGTGDVAERLLDGLKRLEYRGYDCAGIATVHDGIDRPPPRAGQARQPRRASSPPTRCPARPASPTRAGRRTAAPTDDNAHPHIVGDVAVVHNGIIENFKPLRDELIAEGRTFTSQTDTEVVAHLIDRAARSAALAPRDAVAAVLPRLHGAFALAVLFRTDPDLLIGARLGAPLTVGYGDGRELSRLRRARARAADPAHRLSRRGRLGGGDARRHRDLRQRRTTRVERAIVDSGATVEVDRQGQLPPLHAEGDLRAAGRRRPDAAVVPPARRRAGRAADPRLRPRRGPAGHDRRVRHELLCRDGRQILVRAVRPRARRPRCRERVPLPRAGAWSRAGWRCSSASRARPPTRSPRSATRGAEGQKIAVVVNVPTSTMAREADLLLPTHAGPEIGVASTKAFTCQLAVLAALAANLARAKGRLTGARGEGDRPPPRRGAGGDQRRARP